MSNCTGKDHTWPFLLAFDGNRKWQHFLWFQLYAVRNTGVNPMDGA